MKNKKYLVIAIATVILLIIGFMFLNNKNEDKIIFDLPNEETTIIDTDDIPTELLNPDKPASFANVEMTTYRSAENNYEITYPKSWTAILAPKGTGTESDLEDYAIYPKDIPYGPSPILDIGIYNETFEEFTKDMEDVEDFKKISLGGLDGFGSTSRLGNYDVTHYIFELDNGKLMYISYWPNEEYEVTEEEAMWALSTLRVVNE